MHSQPIILIADDDPGGRATLELILTGRGYRFTFAHDGAEALAQARATIPDLILLDVMMPQLDGFEVCRRLRADPQLAEVPVILLTALDDRDSRLAGIEAGADDYLTKPVDRVELRARVATITRLNRYRRLQGERLKFERIAEHAHDGYLMAQEDRIIYANRQARSFLGLNPDGELPAISFLEAARRRYQFEPAGAWETWPELPPGARYLVQSAGAGVAALWLQVECIAVPGQAEGSQMIRLANVTEQLGYQRGIWGFHAALSHKLRTPINGLLGSLTCLSDQVETMEAAELREWIEMARQSAERLDRQVKDVLRYQQAISARPSDWQSSTAQAVREQAARLGRDLAITVTVLPAESGSVESVLPLSSDSFEAVLAELFGNCRKFHPTGTPHIQFSLVTRPTGECVVSIGDDGVNVAPDQLGRVWTPYFQSEASYTGEVHGMGLGLAMVASIIWEAGGHCRMSNQTERPGVVVELFFPGASTSGESRSSSTSTPAAAA